MKKGQYALLIDTETTEPRPTHGGPKFPLVYDIGVVVVDYKARIVDEYCRLPIEIFCDRDRMSNAFYGSKLPLYMQMLTDGRRKMENWETAIKAIDTLIEKWSCVEVIAYNLAFDIRALKNTCSFLGHDESLASNITELPNLDLWAYTAKALPMFNYQMACAHNGWLTGKGNNKSSAEAVAWFCGFLDGSEEHMAVEDCYLEADILAYCLGKHVKRPEHGEKGDWRQFQTKRLSQWGRARYYAAKT